MDEATAVQINRTRGRLYTLPVPLVGIVVWVILWQFGFVASIVAWIIAVATLKLYQKGAGGIGRADVPWIVGVIVFSIVAAFVAGMASDAVGFYIDQVQKGSVLATLVKPDFWSFFAANLMSLDLWSSYAVDGLVALGFGALGSYGVIRQLMRETKSKSAGPVPQG